jgi:hypothetical protein
MAGEGMDYLVPSGSFHWYVALVIRTIICQPSSTELSPNKLVITKNHHFAGKIATLYLLRQHTA